MLGIAVPSALHFAPPAGPAAVLGAAYVLEGSRFGNGMLLRQVQAAGDTCASAATAYLGHKASWPAFLAQLEQQLADPALWHGAVEGALAAFSCFHTALAAEQAEEPLLHA
ncbi:biliverdin-producing heme oxygenase [Pseudoroseomonas wenyumeiae]